MSKIETRVRAAASELHGAIAAAEQAGYRVDYPQQFGDLPAIAISETARLSKLSMLAPGDEYEAMTKRT